MSLQLKGSKQAGLEGTADFDPVASNAHITSELLERSWLDNVSIPEQLDALGKDIDCVKKSLLLEIQFSNYPFLLNNLFRAEILYREGIQMDSRSGDPVQAFILATKAKNFPASNSSLYYEQAVKQLQLLSAQDLFELPTRIVGLFEEVGSRVDAVWNQYPAATSRTLESATEGTCQIVRPEGRATKWILEFNPAD